MNVRDVIERRSSAVALSEPGLDAGQIEAVVQAGTRAPDHGRLSPWRFVVIDGDAREVLGDAMAASLRRRDPEATDTAMAGERAKALRAPTIITVAARITEGKIPAEEQVMAVAAGVQNMILLAESWGFGTMWKTGAAARDAGVKHALGLGEDDRIVAFLYVGTPARVKAARKVDLADLWHRL